MVAEAQLSNITREKLKAAFTYQFDALREHSEKLAIIAGFGKHLLELVDDTPVTPGETREAYDGYEASKASVISINSLTLPFSANAGFPFLLVSYKTAKTLSRTGLPPMPLLALNSVYAPAICLSAANKEPIDVTPKVSISLARIRVRRIARAGYGYLQVRIASMWTRMKMMRRSTRKFLAIMQQQVTTAN